jgi:hypothetical protein
VWLLIVLVPGFGPRVWLLSERRRRRVLPGVPARVPAPTARDGSPFALTECYCCSGGRGQRTQALPAGEERLVSCHNSHAGPEPVFSVFVRRLSGTR